MTEIYLLCVPSNFLDFTCRVYNDNDQLPIMPRNIEQVDGHWNRSLICENKLTKNNMGTVENLN